MSEKISLDSSVRIDIVCFFAKIVIICINIRFL